MWALTRMLRFPLSRLSCRDNKMQQQLDEGESAGLHALGQGAAAPFIQLLRTGTTRVAQGRSYTGMLAAERSRAGSLASALTFLLMQISRL
jgi:hypothetical protein